MSTQYYAVIIIRSTQPCIPPGSLNRVPVLIGWGKGGNVTSTRWQITRVIPYHYHHHHPRVSERRKSEELQGRCSVTVFSLWLWPVTRTAERPDKQLSLQSVPKTVDSRQRRDRRWLNTIWHVSSRSGAVLVAQTAIRFLTIQNPCWATRSHVA